MASGFTATPAELSFVNQLFALHDTQKLGILTGDVAVRAFGGAKLPPTTLGEIWSIADEDNNGWLSRKGVAIALRLIGWAQKGEKPVSGLISKPGPVATIDGLTPLVPQSTGMSGGLPAAAASPGAGLPPLTPQDKAKFQTMFLKAGPTNGLLSGEQARDIFVKSQLPNDTLLRVWNLADTKDRGSLDSTDFIIGMYLIQGIMKKTIPTVPASLPPGLYQQAGGIVAQHTGVASHMTGGSGSMSPVHGAFPQNRSYIQPQMTGQSTGALNSSFSQRPGPTLPPRPSVPQMSSPFASQPTGNWDITAAEKANSDRYFDNLDTQRRGYIEGEVAVPFMLESKLPEATLAQIWDLADINGDGRLTRDGFAVAMYLIQKKLAGQEVPATLPPSLVPPSMRGAAAGASAFGAPQPAAAPEPARDLFSFDDEPTPAAAPALSPTPTGAFSTQATGPMSTPAFSAPPTGVSSPSQTRSPGQPAQDPFGATPFAPASKAKDFLSDDDDTGAGSPALHDQSAEIGNVQNQLNSTNRSLGTAKTDRQNVEQTLANQAAQLSALQTQLSSAKAAYETETKLLSTLRERFSAQTSDIQKTREELIRAESDLSAVRVEKSEVEQALLRDKEEARDLHRKMIEAGQQADALKAEVEKIKRDAKQQKGMLAVARKQLLAKETDRSKAQAEVNEANTELAATIKEREEVEAELTKEEVVPAAIPPPGRMQSQDSLSFAAAQALPATPDLGSPSAASTKSNNPFERLQQNSTPRSGSPFQPFAGATTASPPPATNGAAAKDDDPFGFSQPVEEKDPLKLAEPTKPAGTDASEVATQSSPTITPTVISVPEATPEDIASVTSPTSAGDTDDFATPPSTAAGHSDSATKQNTLDGVPSKFPAIDESSCESTIPGAKAVDTETYLNSQLKELDVEESDSNATDSEDEVPLAKIADERRASLHETKQEATTEPPKSGTESTFDDIFGAESAAPLRANAAPPAAAPQEPVDAFGVPIQKSSSPFAPANGTAPAAPSTGPAGVDAFDQAMGNISPASAGPNESFSFESAFEDTFDFNSASNDTNLTPAPAAANGAVNGTSPAITPSQPAASNDDGFGSLFTSPNGATQSPAPVATPQAAPTPSPALFPTPAPAAPAITNGAAKPADGSGLSFDEVFSGFDSGPSLSLGANQAAAKGPESPVHQPFPASASSPPRNVKTPPPRAESPGFRSRSPPLRVGSPKTARPSTSSSERAPERPSQPAPRHSKLSLRLPFGKKKKHHDPAPPPPPPAQFLTPPAEEGSTPALPDDADAVKQLTAMGFSRTQAVGALEKHGYDVPRALNSLLGQ